MKNNLLGKIIGKRNIAVMIALLTATLTMAGCSVDSLTGEETSIETEAEGDANQAENQDSGSNNKAENMSTDGAPAGPGGATSGSSYTNNGTATTGLLDTSDMFSDRDLEQEADLTNAEYITLTSGEDVTISAEGVYVISGTATDTSIIVEADSAKVQLVLDGVSITNTDFPAIYVKEADKVFVTTTDSENILKVTGSFTTDGDENTDAVIYSKDDIVLNGVGTLTIESTANGISGKDDIKFTGGTYVINVSEDAVEAKDSIRISDGSFTITSGKDGFHSENSDDLTLGFVYISGGNLTIDADGDGIQATTVLMIDGGTIDINAAECLEGTFIQINGGDITLYGTDDGINASSKSTSYDVVIEINGGNLSIEMASGDTDALDAHGSLIVNGGNIDITAQFAFDYDTNAEFNGGTITVNGEEVTDITESMTFGGMGGGFGGGNGGPGGKGGFQGNGDASSGEFSGEFPGEPPEGFNGEAPSGDFPGEPPEGFNGEAPSGEMPSGQAPSGDFQNGQGGPGNKTGN